MKIHTRVDECRHNFFGYQKEKIVAQKRSRKEETCRIIQALRFANCCYKTLLRKRKEMCLGEKLFFPFHTLVLFFIPVN